MRTMRPILPVVFLLVPALCPAQDNCLWLNAATAGGILGGPVTATVSRADSNLSNAQTANAKSSAGPMSANPSATNYSRNSIDDSDCTFARHEGPVAAELRIEVRTMSEPGKEFGSFIRRCGNQAMPLKAIGNEATVCPLNGKAGELLEQVVGRVRERAFVIRLRTNDSSMTQSSLREKARTVGEQVARNCFEQSRNMD